MSKAGNFSTTDTKRSQYRSCNVVEKFRAASLCSDPPRRPWRCSEAKGRRAGGLASEDEAAEEKQVQRRSLLQERLETLDPQPRLASQAGKPSLTAAPAGSG